MERPISQNDLRAIANHLEGKTDLTIAVSEMGFDPAEYPHMRKWLREIGLKQDKSTRWYYDKRFRE